MTGANADDCSIMNLDLDFQDIAVDGAKSKTTCHYSNTNRLSFIECLLKQSKHDKTYIRLQMFPNRPAARALLGLRNAGIEILFRIAMPRLLGRFACEVVFGGSPIQCCASQVSDLGLTS